MNWYSKLKTAQMKTEEPPVPSTYLDVGHSGYNNPVYGCNYMWGLDEKGQFFTIPEEEKTKSHSAFKEQYYTFAYAGRIDTCKKQASFLSVNDCRTFIGNQSASKMRSCEQLRNQAMIAIHAQFGSDIHIMDFEATRARF